MTTLNLLYLGYVMVGLFIATGELPPRQRSLPCRLLILLGWPVYLIVMLL